MPSLASFGDIAFLLIIFFVLASDFAKEPPGKVDLAKSPELETLASAKVVVVIDKEDRVYLNGQEVYDPDSVEAAVLVKYENVTESSKRIVQFKCHRAATKATFEPIVGAIAKAGALIAVLGEEGDPETPIH